MAPTFVNLAFSSLLLFSSLTLSNAAAATFEKRALTIPNDLPTGWTSQGCYTDTVAARTLTLATYTDTTGMTDEACVNFCIGKGAIYAGTEYAQECFCGNSLSNGGAAAAAGDCNMACTGAPGEPCGAGNRLNLFKSSATPPAGPVTNPGPPGWGILGCYTDSVNARTLPQGVPVTGGAGAMTVELCVAACAGYTYAGIEYASECYCGNAFANGGGPAPDGYTGCNMPCNGNTAEYCGGPNRLDVYQAGKVVSSSSTASTTKATTTTTMTTTSKATTTAAAPTGWTLLGCYTDAVNARTLTVGMAVVGGPAAMTPEVCTAACQAAGYILSGVEYSAECYCDNSLHNGGGPAPDGNTGCNMACNGNAAETCGGANRLDLYSFGGATPSSSTTTTGTKTTTTSAVSTVTGLPKGWSYKGCWIDGVGGRILPQETDSATMTVETCVADCVALGYSVAGIEYSTQCFCGNYVQNGGALATADTDCAMACGGNANEKCGGPNRISMYSNATITVYAAPSPKTAGLPGSWVYQGCLADMVNYERTFPYAIDNLNANNTAEACLGLCSAYGYSAGGMEYGNQCYCGDLSDVYAAGATLIASTSCNTPCPGNPTELCGGGNAIQYYRWDNLNTWHYASGNAAGEYQFLIGGVVVPLIVTPGVNGKVTFVEKYGTGPANSSGSYELDLTEIDNFSQAWRTLHGLQTDVFCSASLTLPDRVGRQINIGGWSGVSTFGLRLYWPDGSPGVAGTNGWQENQFELQLQNGRWYPSAMTMANGSILVVGGEDGSNGKPVPTLETLPRPAGGPTTLYMDWLDRTDPNNLYPFLVVLPGGGIFVGYYNEARILNQVTFATTTVLPNIPGAVNNFLAGRTYPLEGTAVIMPQIAPYTDPLTILICGGSTPYQGIALDNCVSIQPEVAGATWQLERMPSQRVITSMTALPDGTYLILNGAHQGMAGFGLATQPNLNCVMYNPTLPKNQRFTVMANTTIDRLYHSEAVLLDDGRVLVSGSDPEDPRFPQEYRVEVFIPPYLMGSPARPTFSITNKDWAYGQSITFTGNGVTKVSLLGAVSSTHGNSMGQRTFFPAMSCSGTSCTVTAPPNAHICPPGWFQMFTLNAAGVPSIAQWVRIGGDPASLGNWPPYADFNVPGMGAIGPTASALLVSNSTSAQSNLTRRDWAV